MRDSNFAGKNMPVWHDFSGNLPAERHVEGRVAFGVADVDVDAAGRAGVVVQEQLEHLEGYIKVYWVGRNIQQSLIVE